MYLATIAIYVTPQTLSEATSRLWWFVLAHPRDGCYCTAVGQILAFSQMAQDPVGERQPQGLDERRSAMTRLNTWSRPS